MTDIDLIKREIKELDHLAHEIDSLGSELIDTAELSQITDPDNLFMGDPHFEFEKVLHPDLKHLQHKALRDYEKFYIAGLHFVNEFLPEKKNEFISCYERDNLTGEKGVVDFLRLKGAFYTGDVEEIMHQFIDRLETQRSILSAIPFIARIKEMKLREIISADFIEREIEQAELLFEGKQHRAAGVIAGVALEKHLKNLCEKSNVDYEMKDTIHPLSEKLHKEGKIEKTQMRKIQYLGSIRNKCSHPEEIEITEVRELIDGVKKIV